MNEKSIVNFSDLLKYPKPKAEDNNVQELEGVIGAFPKTRNVFAKYLPDSAKDLLDISKDGKITATGREPNV